MGRIELPSTASEMAELGKKIREASETQENFANLKKDPDAYFGALLDLSKHHVEILANSWNVTHIVVPHKGYMMDPAGYTIPGGYDRNNSEFQGEGTRTALDFRIGDYTFAECG